MGDDNRHRPSGRRPGDDGLSDERDFAKHGGARQFAKITQVWQSLPFQLARENKKFLYGIVREGARAREYEDAVVWLESAGLIYRVNRSSRPGLPVSAYDEGAFKVYALDIGVLRRLARLDASIFSQSERMFSEFKGAFAENYVLQALMPQLDGMPRYWASDKPRHEVDYLIQLGNSIIPCEVKAGTNVKSPSLKYYFGKYADATPMRVRFSLRNLSSGWGRAEHPAVPVRCRREIDGCGTRSLARSVTIDPTERNDSQGVSQSNRTARI